MSHSLSRRHFIASTSALCIAPVFMPGVVLSQDTYAGGTTGPIHPQFPSQDPVRVKEMVGASHAKVERVRELLGESPALAKAAYDWGYGDWETALGAASHVGNREIASLLMANGARPDIFTFAMLGQLEVVKAYITANPGIQRTHGPHGLTLLHHARKGGDESLAVVEYLEKAGDADIGPTSLPLTDDEKRMYTGEYSFGKEPSHAFKVSIDKNNRLNITRQPEGTNLVMFHQGNHEFHPAGAPAVRIRFEEKDDKALSLTVIDGKLLLKATRV